MASAVKYEVFTTDLCNKVHDLSGSMDTLKVALTNTAPNVSTHTTFSQITEISAGNGYTAGGATATATSGAASGVVTVSGTDVVFTASGGSIGPFRYAVLYNDTPTSPADPLILYWDYGSSVTLSTGETFTVDFGASLFTVT